MQFIRYAKNHTLHILYVALICIFLFVYFILYRTSSRVTWYTQMQIQSENMIHQFRDAIGIHS